MLTWLAACATTCHLGSGVAHGATEVLGNQTRQSHGAYAHIEATVLAVTLRSMCQGCKRRCRQVARPAVTTTTAGPQGHAGYRVAGCNHLRGHLKAAFPER